MTIWFSRSRRRAGMCSHLEKEERSLSAQRRGISIMTYLSTSNLWINEKSMLDEPRVVIIVLNWNGKNDTIECLRSLQQLSYQNFEILVVDNGSTDGSVACFRQEFPDVSVAENNTNLGFAEGNNVGIRWAIRRGPDYVLLLNNDTIVDKDFLTELTAVAETDPSIGFAGPKVYHCDFKGRKDVISFAGATIGVATGKAYRFGQNTIDRGQYDRVRETDYVEGSCLLARVDCLNRVGLLNTTYRLYWEDIELCFRGRKAGYKSVYVPSATIWHKVGIRASVRRVQGYYYGGRNRMLFVKEYATSSQLLIFLCFLLAFDLWKVILVSIFKDKSMPQAVAYLKGTIDGFFDLGLGDEPRESTT